MKPLFGAGWCYCIGFLWAFLGACWSIAVAITRRPEASWHSYACFALGIFWFILATMREKD